MKDTCDRSYLRRGRDDGKDGFRTFARRWVPENGPMVCPTIEVETFGEWSLALILRYKGLLSLILWTSVWTLASIVRDVYISVTVTVSCSLIAFYLRIYIVLHPIH